MHVCRSNLIMDGEASTGWLREKRKEVDEEYQLGKIVTIVILLLLTMHRTIL